ncbi:anti-sigma factor family protein [Thermogemmatispora sp.]|uniref:anti-sigma factor family protein n=1 Tax=Thermogemmatispora sp. TaxID=1968838 RepID=UPI001DDD9D37|nr:zf-HC2 domain-containing protein [Thermogemmatispora sp.]MBX5451216.1 zf-HC2 domain-containing protein [Thermogemmatispora sp.]
MRCSEAADQLQLYLDGRLSVERTRALEAHLARCASCRIELELLEEVVRHLESLQMVAEPADLSLRIMERVARTPQQQPSSILAQLRPSPGELLAAALLATIASLGSLLTQPALLRLLPLEGGPLMGLLASVTHLLQSMDATTLTLVCWVMGTLVGICITLLVVGEELRSRWLRAVWERLPVLH